MANYRVTWIEKRQHYFEVEADSPEDAIEAVENMNLDYDETAGDDSWMETKEAYEID